MKDRLIGMMGTLGLALVLSAAMPTAGAFATGGSGGSNSCTGGCGTETVAGRVLCRPPHTCAGSNAGGGACGCTQLAFGGCPCS
jgi:hypothetical protein